MCLPNVRIHALFINKEHLTINFCTTVKSHTQETMTDTNYCVSS